MILFVDEVFITSFLQAQTSMLFCLDVESGPLCFITFYSVATQDITLCIFEVKLNFFVHIF